MKFEPCDSTLPHISRPRCVTSLCATLVTGNDEHHSHVCIWGRTRCLLHQTRVVWGRASMKTSIECAACESVLDEPISCEYACEQCLWCSSYACRHNKEPTTAVFKQLRCSAVCGWQLPPQFLVFKCVLHRCAIKWSTSSAVMDGPQEQTFAAVSIYQHSFTARRVSSMSAQGVCAI
jgi:hypothetical protein